MSGMISPKPEAKAIFVRSIRFFDLFKLEPLNSLMKLRLLSESELSIVFRFCQVFVEILPSSGLPGETTFRAFAGTRLK